MPQLEGRPPKDRQEKWVNKRIHCILLETAHCETDIQSASPSGQKLGKLTCIPIHKLYLTNLYRFLSTLSYSIISINKKKSKNLVEINHVARSQF